MPCTPTAPTPLLQLTPTDQHPYPHQSSTDQAALDFVQGCIVIHAKDHSDPPKMKFIATNLQLMLLILVSNIAASNPAAANDHQLQIEANDTSTFVQLCSSNESCKSIRFSAILTKPIPEDEEPDSTQASQNNPSLVDNINNLLFGR